MTELSQDELTVLLVAREGEPMMPIGRWEAPVRSLLARGYLRSHRHEGDPTGYFNNYITPQGKLAADKAEDDSLRAVINTSNKIATARGAVDMKVMRLTRPDGEIVLIVKEMVVSWSPDENGHTKIFLLNGFQVVQESSQQIEIQMVHD